MAKSTHEKQLERARARREQEHAEQRRATGAVIAVVAALVVFAVGLGAVLIANRDGDDSADASSLAIDDDTDQPGDEVASEVASAVDDGAAPAPCPAPGGSLPAATTEAYDEQPTADLGGAPTVSATLETTCGDIVLALDAEAAPTTVGNFVALAEDGYYEGVPFHRVIDDFMIQGGDPTGTGTGCLDAACGTRLPGYTFEDELTLAEQVTAEAGGYPRGTLAMANAGPDTNGSQFFIVQAAPAYPLPPDYAVFGQVTEGMDVVDSIAAGPVDGQLAADPAIILGVTVDR